MTIVQVLVLSVIQGACELLPVSSSAHVLVAAKLMGIDPSSPQMTFLLVMLHTGTMFAVIVYFWQSWRNDYFSSSSAIWKTTRELIVASFATAVVGGTLSYSSRKCSCAGGHTQKWNRFLGISP